MEMEKDHIGVGDRVVYQGFHGIVVQMLPQGRCVIRLDTKHLISAPLAELRLIEKRQPPPGSGGQPGTARHYYS